MALFQCVRDNWKWDEPILVRLIIAYGVRFDEKYAEQYDNACRLCVCLNRPGMLAELLDEKARICGGLLMNSLVMGIALKNSHRLCAKVILDRNVVLKPSPPPMPKWLALWLELRRGARVATVLVYRALRTQGAEKRLSANVAWEIWQRRFTL